MSNLSMLYELESGVQFREAKRPYGKYRYYLLRLPDVWIDKVARELGIAPKKLRLKLCFNEIHGLLVVPVKPPKNKPSPVENAELVERLEK